MLLIGLVFVAVLGIGIAALLYPWRKPVWRPYLDIIVLLLAPLVVIATLQAVFALPPGSCVERPINNAPLILAIIEAGLGIVTAIIFPRARWFAIVLATGLFPITLGWAFIATMSLAGCWI
ncbi:hypothetical protein [Brevundimonas sp.]|uniref:hypothetical protein n=1 Tax=Brevundimonas sp. TaxID=1871086 RepID=UPI003F6EBB83